MLYINLNKIKAISPIRAIRQMNIAKKILTMSIFLALLSLSLLAVSNSQIIATETSFNKTKSHEHEQQGDEDRHDDHDKDEYDDHDEGEHDDHDEDENAQHAYEEHQEEGFVNLSSEQQKMAGIKVSVIKTQKNVNQIISAPGEVVNDLYNTTLLTTQIDSKVVKRKVVLGQYVKNGKIIAILYSLDIATVQNQLKVSLSEWQRVTKLGKQAVGAKRFINAKADMEKNKSLLQAYGFNHKLIKQFILGRNSYKQGEYPVIAPHDGVILEDNFQSGQFLKTGSTIALLVDEDHVWVEALLAPEIGQRIPVGTKAKIVIGNKTFFSVVIHDSHAIDEITRTRKIRLFIENKEHLLHAGLFAKVFLELPLFSNKKSINEASEDIILLPETALMRSSDGDWTVFIEQEKGLFKQEEVELENTINGMHRIKGLKAGQRVAIKGAFFLASELAKGGFDPHNH
jgi:membrane fusion protein, heavy metal efflux system